MAAKAALEELGGISPKLAFILVDASWQALLEGQSGEEVRAVREVLGEDVPIAGGYTFGQVGRDSQSGQVALLNQHIEVVVLG